MYFAIVNNNFLISIKELIKHIKKKTKKYAQISIEEIKIAIKERLLMNDLLVIE